MMRDSPVPSTFAYCYYDYCLPLLLLLCLDKQIFLVVEDGNVLPFFFFFFFHSSKSVAFMWTSVCLWCVIFLYSPSPCHHQTEARQRRGECKVAAAVRTADNHFAQTTKCDKTLICLFLFTHSFILIVCASERASY